jgi:hypothetical protein
MRTSDMPIALASHEFGRPTGVTNAKHELSHAYVSRLTATLAVIMAGGRGERLKHPQIFAVSLRRRSAANSGSSISCCRTA